MNIRIAGLSLILLLMGTAANALETNTKVFDEVMSSLEKEGILNDLSNSQYSDVEDLVKARIANEDQLNLTDGASDPAFADFLKRVARDIAGHVKKAFSIAKKLAPKALAVAKKYGPQLLELAKKLDPKAIQTATAFAEKLGVPSVIVQAATSMLGKVDQNDEEKVSQAVTDLIEEGELEIMMEQ